MLCLCSPKNCLDSHLPRSWYSVRAPQCCHPRNKVFSSSEGALIPARRHCPCLLSHQNLGPQPCLGSLCFAGKRRYCRRPRHFGLGVCVASCFHQLRAAQLAGSRRMLQCPVIRTGAGALRAPADTPSGAHESVSDCRGCEQDSPSPANWSLD